MTIIRCRNGNCIAALQPSRDDLFVVTILRGQMISIRPGDEYEAALRVARAFADGVQMPPRSTITVKLFGMSLDEVLAFKRIDRGEFVRGLTTSDADLRSLIEEACRSVLLGSNDSAARCDAMEILDDLHTAQPEQVP